MWPFSENVFSTTIIIFAVTMVKLCGSTVAVTQVHYTQEKVIKNCTYMVTIGTTCTKGAETSNPVSLRFGDAKSNEITVHHLNSKQVRRVDPLEPQVLDDVPQKPFQACMVDQFTVTGRCMESPVCYLYLKLVGNDDWRPGFACVHVVESQKRHLSSNRFYFRRYLPRRVWHGSNVCEMEITSFGLKNKRKVFERKLVKGSEHNKD